MIFGFNKFAVLIFVLTPVFVAVKYDKLTSCGGTSNVNVLMSTFWQESTQGTMKNIPGPLAPPAKSLPSLNITTRSYS